MGNETLRRQASTRTVVEFPVPRIQSSTASIISANGIDFSAPNRAPFASLSSTIEEEKEDAQQKVDFRILRPEPRIPGSRPLSVATIRLSSRHESRLLEPDERPRSHVEPIAAPVTALPLAPHLPKTHKQPILPIIRLMILCFHLAILTSIPCLMVKYIIQPLVLWLILIVALVLQLVYLLPEIILEFIGIARGRPV